MFIIKIFGTFLHPSTWLIEEAHHLTLQTKGVDAFWSHSKGS